MFDFCEIGRPAAVFLTPLALSFPFPLVSYRVRSLVRQVVVRSKVADWKLQRARRRPAISNRSVLLGVLTHRTMMSMAS